MNAIVHFPNFYSLDCWRNIHISIVTLRNKDYFRGTVCSRKNILKDIIKSGSFNYRLSVVIGTDIKRNSFLKNVSYEDGTTVLVLPFFGRIDEKR